LLITSAEPVLTIFEDSDIACPPLSNKRYTQLIFLLEKS
jgi:hypothetical protein